MEKNFKKFVLISVCFCLLPILYGLFLYDKLPDMVPTHFDFEGNINGYTSKNIFVFGLPILMAVMDLVSAVMTYYDPFDKNRVNKNPKIIKFLLLIIPVMTNIVFLISCRAAMGDSRNYSFTVGILAGIILIFCGNYMPKNKLNSTVGVKTPWTLKDETNWIKTNTLAGYLFVISGVLIIFTSVFRIRILVYISFIFLFLSSIGVYLYSFYLYKKTL